MDRSVFTPGFLAKEKSYITSDLHSLIGVENRPGFFSLDNIGINGENLTIAVLSMNRSALTIRLLKSIYQFLPDFGGKVLIGDNGSTQTELQILKSAAAKCRSTAKSLNSAKTMALRVGEIVCSPQSKRIGSFRWTMTCISPRTLAAGPKGHKLFRCAFFGDAFNRQRERKPRDLWRPPLS